MLIYLALLIPFVIAFCLYRFYQRSVTWWEYFVPLGVSIILVVSSKAITEHVQVTSKEYWGAFVERIEYYEQWDEWITQTCTRQCCCDSKGENCSLETYDCSYRLYHPAEYQIITTIGESISIGRQQYEQLKSKLKNEVFTDLHRDYYTIDGDMYSCTWDRDSAKAVPVTSLHHYENRVKAADQSVFHFEKVSKEQRERYGIKEYPPITENYKQRAVIGDSSANAAGSDARMQYINGLLGPIKEVRLFVLIYQDQPREAGIYQQWYWSGANMNEFVVCIGIDKSRRVKWCYPFSWTRAEILKTRVKDFVQSQDSLDLNKLADFLQPEIQRSFIRRDFKEFNYLTVEPPVWAIILTFILTLVANIGTTWWIINNEYGSESIRSISDAWRRIR